MSCCDRSFMRRDSLHSPGSGKGGNPKWVLAVLLLIGGSSITSCTPISQSPRSHDSEAVEVIRGRRFELVDRSGAVRARIGFGEDKLEKDSPMFTLLGKDGKTPKAIILSWEEQGGAPALLLFDDRGNIRSQLAVGENGSPFLILFSAGGKRRAQMFLDATDSPRMELLAPDGSIIWKAP
jgi:hypothetical protein